MPPISGLATATRPPFHAYLLGPQICASLSSGPSVDRSVRSVSSPRDHSNFPVAVLHTPGGFSSDREDPARIRPSAEKFTDFSRGRDKTFPSATLHN